MAPARRRHVKPASRQLRDVVAWGLVGLVATAGLMVWLGVPWETAAAGCAGLLLVLLLAYLLNRSGLMRLTHLDAPPTARSRDADEPPPSTPH